MDRQTLDRIKRGEEIRYVIGREICDCRPYNGPYTGPGTGYGEPIHDCQTCGGTGWTDVPVVAAPGSGGFTMEQASRIGRG